MSKVAVMLVLSAAIATACAGSPSAAGSGCAPSYVAVTYVTPLPIVAGTVWYDPGDDGSTDDGSDSPPADSNGDGTDTTGSDGAGDGSGDGSGGGTEAVRLRMSTAPSGVGATSAGACFTCQLSCNLDAPSASGISAGSANGYSNSSADSACAAAQSELAAWAHGEGRRLATCTRNE
jgi:hypothetical protein